MNANMYQRACRQFDNHQLEAGFFPLVLGLCAEAGEVANEFERSCRKGGTFVQTKVAIELGDVMWNVARLADELGYTLEHIMEMNIGKLTARYQERGIPIREVANG